MSIWTVRRCDRCLGETIEPPVGGPGYEPFPALRIFEKDLCGTCAAELRARVARFMLEVRNPTIEELNAGAKR